MEIVSDVNQSVKTRPACLSLASELRRIGTRYVTINANILANIMIMPPDDINDLFKKQRFVIFIIILAMYNSSAICLQCV
jgi:hypothetical protein